MSTDFLRSSSKAKCAILDAIELLRIRKSNYAGDSESRRITLEIAQLKAKYAKIEEYEQIFIADQTKIKQPTDDDFKTIEENVKAIDKMIAKTAATDAIIETVANIFNAYERSQA